MDLGRRSSSCVLVTRNESNPEDSMQVMIPEHCEVSLLLQLVLTGRCFDWSDVAPGTSTKNAAANADDVVIRRLEAVLGPAASSLQASVKGAFLSKRCVLGQPVRLFRLVSFEMLDSMEQYGWTRVSRSDVERALEVHQHPVSELEARDFNGHDADITFDLLRQVQATHGVCDTGLPQSLVNDCHEYSIHSRMVAVALSDGVVICTTEDIVNVHSTAYSADCQWYFVTRVVTNTGDSNGSVITISRSREDRGPRVTKAPMQRNVTSLPMARKTLNSSTLSALNNSTNRSVTSNARSVTTSTTMSTRSYQQQRPSVPLKVKLSPPKSAQESMQLTRAARLSAHVDEHTPRHVESRLGHSFPTSEERHELWMEIVDGFQERDHVDDARVCDVIGQRYSSLQDSTALRLAVRLVDIARRSTIARSELKYVLMFASVLDVHRAALSVVAESSHMNKADFVEIAISMGIDRSTVALHNAFRTLDTTNSDRIMLSAFLRWYLYEILGEWMLPSLRNSAASGQGARGSVGRSSTPGARPSDVVSQGRPSASVRSRSATSQISQVSHVSQTSLSRRSASPHVPISIAATENAAATSGANKSSSQQMKSIQTLLDPHYVPPVLSTDELPNTHQRRELFAHLDVHHVERIACADLPKLIRAVYPDYQAEAATKLAATAAIDSDPAYLTKKEFGNFLRALVHCHSMWSVVNGLRPTGKDTSLNPRTFIIALQRLETPIPDAEKVFRQITDNTNSMTFGRFTLFWAQYRAGIIQSDTPVSLSQPHVNPTGINSSVRHDEGGPSHSPQPQHNILSTLTPAGVAQQDQATTKPKEVYQRGLSRGRTVPRPVLTIAEEPSHPQGFHPHDDKTMFGFDGAISTPATDLLDKQRWLTSAETPVLGADVAQIDFGELE